MPNVSYLIKRNSLEKKIIQHIGIDIFDIHYAESDNCIVEGRNGKQYQYVIKYFPMYKIIIIWNVNSSNKYSIKISIKQLQEYLSSNKCKVWYESKNKTKLYKVIAINEDFLVDFLDDYEAFMRDNEFDLEDDSDLKIDQLKVDWGSEKERAVRNVLQKVRDSNFRDKVLKRYGYQCAICRCPISQLLVAAHERNYEVRNTNVDMYEHGICLCQNHHLMYDKKISEDDNRYLIDINLSDGTITINDKRIEAMPWYKTFIEKYKGKIIKPDNW